jgi:hypothetical protein
MGHGARLKSSVIVAAHDRAIAGPAIFASGTQASTGQATWNPPSAR